MGEKSKNRKKGSISEEDVATLLERYAPTTILTLLQEISHFANVKIDWDCVVKNTATGISSAREYQMLWRHLAYRHALPENFEDATAPADDGSDLEIELEACPSVTNDASVEAAACVKVLIASALQSDSNASNGSSIEAPLTINTPRHFERTCSENAQHACSIEGKNITIPVFVQRQALPTMVTAEPVDTNVSANSNQPPKKKRKQWSEEEDMELIAAVQKCGEGNWANILKSDFRGDRTASQLSQRWAIIRRRKGKLGAGLVKPNGSLSEAQLAARRAMNYALDDMPKRSLAAGAAAVTKFSAGRSVIPVATVGGNISKPQETSAATSQAVQTATSQAVQTATSQAVQTATSQAVQTATSQAVPTATSQAVPTATSQAVPTATSQAVQTATSQSVQTATSQAVQTATSQAVQTATSQAVQTATPNLQNQPDQVIPVSSQTVVGTSQSQQSQQVYGLASSRGGALFSVPKPRVASSKASVKPAYSPDSMVKAAAVAAGARIVTQDDAVSLIKSANAVHMMGSGGGSLIKSSFPGCSNPSSTANTNMNFIRSMATAPLSSRPTPTSVPQLSGRSAKVVAPVAHSAPSNGIASSEKPSDPIVPCKSDLVFQTSYQEAKSMTVTETTSSSPRKQVQGNELSVANNGPNEQLQEDLAALSDPSATHTSKMSVDDQTNCSTDMEIDDNNVITDECQSVESNDAGTSTESSKHKVTETLGVVSNENAVNNLLEETEKI